MKHLIITITLACAISVVQGQTIDELTRDKELIKTSILSLTDSLKHIEKLITAIKNLNTITTEPLKSFVKENVYISPIDASGNQLTGLLHKGDSIFIYDYENPYYLIRHNRYIGLIDGDAVHLTKEVKAFTKNIKKVKAEKREYDNESNYSYTPSNRSSGSHTIHTGPRGGHYYINKNGNKTYVKKH